MGNCCGTTTTPDTEAIRLQQLSPPLAGVPTSGPVCGSLQKGGIPPAQKLRKTVSAPNAQLTKDSANSLLLPSPSARALSESSVAPSSRQTSAVTPRSPPAQYPIRRLTSTVRQVLSEHLKFRILVVGESGCGKSSLIKAIFKVDDVTEDTRGNVDIDVEFRPKDNCYLIVHECSGLGPQTGNSQNLQTIRDFILHRTDASCSDSERLHAVWICVPASDAIDGRLGGEAEEILGMKTVPVVLVLTKFDIVVSEVLFDIPRDDAQRHERAKANALKMYEESCRHLFHKDPRVLPVSERPRYADLVEKLVVVTDRCILGSPGPSAGFGVPGEKSRVNAVPLAWSAALRASRDIIVQTSIEVGRSRYWRHLWSSDDFAGHSLKSCVNVIHVDLVEIWNLNDRTGYLSSDEFKAKMSHIVKDLEGPTSTMSGPYRTRAGVEFAGWVRHVYRDSKEDVRCVMGYIVDLIVILDDIFGTISGDISPESVAPVIGGHIDSGQMNKIHDKIRTFVTETFALSSSVPQDLILEKIIDLIQEFCGPPRRK